MFTFTYPKTKMLYNSLYGWGQDFSESLKENAESVLKRWEGRWMPGERRVTREAIHSHLEVLITLRYIRGEYPSLAMFRCRENGKKIDSNVGKSTSLSPRAFHSTLLFPLTFTLFFIFLLFFIFFSLSFSSTWSSIYHSSSWEPGPHGPVEHGTTTSNETPPPVSYKRT